jgi:hypothetical protein
MATYQLRVPVLAVRYEARVNEQEVFAVLNFGGGRASFDNVRGYLHCYNNDGHDTDVHPGEWVVRIGGGFAVLSDGEFTETFARVSD